MSKRQGRRPKHVPQRTCIVCRQSKDKRSLTRIVRTPDAGVLVDATGKRNGRGAYVCHQPACWEKILNHRSLLNQALKTEVSEAEIAAVAAHKPVAIDES